MTIKEALKIIDHNEWWAAAEAFTRQHVPTGRIFKMKRYQVTGTVKEAFDDLIEQQK